MSAQIKCLSREASFEWLAKHQYTEPYDEGFRYRNCLKSPIDSGKKSALVKSIMTWLPSDGECLMLITGWGVWPSCENRELYERLRASVGERRPIHEAPGQILKMTERGALECMLVVCLYNYWDALLADDAHRCLITCSHDEYVTINSNTELAERVQATVGLFGQEGTRE